MLVELAEKIRKFTNRAGLLIFNTGEIIEDAKINGTMTRCDTQKQS